MDQTDGGPDSMVLSPGSGRKNAPRDEAGHFLPNVIEDPRQDFVIPQDDEDVSMFDAITHPRKRGMLAAYCVIGTVRGAALEAGIQWKTHYWWLANDPQYAEAWKLAEWIYAHELEDEVTRRGKDGVVQVVRDKNGNEVGTRIAYSDLLLIFRTKAQWPGKYGDKVTINIEDRVRQVAEELGVDPEEAVLEAQKLLGPGKAR